LSDITFTAYTAASQKFQQNEATWVTQCDEDRLALVALRNGRIFTKGQTLTKGLFFALDKP